MGINTGAGYRIGSVKNRDQVYNPRTQLYVKRDTVTGKFMAVKVSGGKFKGIAEYVDHRRKYAKQ